MGRGWGWSDHEWNHRPCARDVIDAMNERTSERECHSFKRMKRERHPCVTPLHSSRSEAERSEGRVVSAATQRYHDVS
jgi:hypothetical protein